MKEPVKKNPVKTDPIKPMENIKVAARGQGWLCIEKPAGISVHNEPGHDILSLLAAQLFPPGVSRSLLQPVHRLDKETSGLLLLATNPEMLTHLSALFAKGEVQKKYLALVHGTFDMEKETVFVWDTPLSKEAGGRNNPAGKGKKVTAITQYKLLEQTPHYALLEIELFTGRKHQIRRHAKLAGHPITGDSRYGSLRSIQFLKENCNYHRLGLHAFHLSFQAALPNCQSPSPIVVTSDIIPSEIKTLLQQDL